jgi:hypothetical protein
MYDETMSLIFFGTLFGASKVYVSLFKNCAEPL